MKPWYHAGLRFECTGCGGCCRARGAYDRVYASAREIAAIARRLGMSLGAFLRRHTRIERDDGRRTFRFRDGACPFLDGTRCGIYADRPSQCRTWPFWPENLDRRTWTKEVAPVTPGIGRGRLYTRAEIEAIARAADRDDDANAQEAAAP